MCKDDMDDDGTGSRKKPELGAFLRKKSSKAESGAKNRSPRSGDSSDEDWLRHPLLPPQLKRSFGGSYLCDSLKDFSWRRQKWQVLSVCGSLAVLFFLALVLETFKDSANFSMARALLWLLCVLLSLLLLYFLCCDYDGSRIVCQALFPLVILLACAAWYVPKVVCAVRDDSARCKLLDPLPVFLVSSLPLLLLSAPVMALRVACALAGLVLLVFLSFAVYSSRDLEFISSAPWVLSPFVFLSSVLVSYHGWRSEKELFALACSLKKAVSCSRLNTREVQAELRNVKKDSSERIAKMRQFISYIFHEIRVPFNAVVLGIGHLLATNVSEEQQEVLNMMDSSSSSMIRILNDVLDMGKIESGKLQLEKQPFNLAELVSSLIWAFKDTLESKGLEFSLCVDDCTKEFLSTHDLVGDKHRIRQVLANYLSNATKFTPRGGRVKLHVVWNRTKQDGSGDVPADSPASHAKQELSELSKKRCVASVTVSVEDTGIGISKEDQVRLFEPYIQVHTGSTQSQGGTGLGLSFAKRIVELAGGKIGVFSDTGRGSVFSFTIPFEVAGTVSIEGKAAEEVLVNPFDLPEESRVETGVVAASGGLSSSQQPPRPTPKVLIVEDNQVNRRILKKLLASFNIESDAAEDGLQAVDMCRSGAQYDMILIDKEMPVMDGHEATREIRAMGVKTTIVGLTGNALDSDRNQFLAAGVNDFFTKPLSRHQLLRLLEAHGLVR
ncbi:two-component system protein A [Selaginella moellendorffii]|nr:two-component system protein A [Selaginella moellendorffii]|eukprot:XP_002986002.2 two-component system protein A [Selaginella moellendorffii]